MPCDADFQTEARNGYSICSFAILNIFNISKIIEDLWIIGTRKIDNFCAKVQRNIPFFYLE